MFVVDQHVVDALADLGDDAGGGIACQRPRTLAGQRAARGVELAGGQQLQGAAVG